jgi:hypothetical protein
MKSAYTAPKLTSLGNVAEITQVLGGTTRTDFTYLNGTPISGGNDLGSSDICGANRSSLPAGARCDSRF